MLDDKTIVSVTNRDNCTVMYIIPDLGNLRRTYQPGETKEVTVEELKKLSYIRGGDVLLRDSLMISDKELAEELLNKEVEPEYYYTKDEVKKLLLEGSLEQLEDCLDFAPQGVVEWIKELAVELEINDIAKRHAITKSTGLNVTKAIEANQHSKARQEENEKIKAATRRAAPITEAPKSNYKIVK